MQLRCLTQQSELDDFLEHASKSDVLAIDTEFIREKTYWPNLCLLQMATAERVALVDPFEITDLSSLKEIFANENVMKVFHAASQDLEIFHHEIGVLPRPIFDTQIAAALLGTNTQSGLGNTINAFLGVNIKKAESFTDWSLRPLTPSQLKYAAEDVIYLPQLYYTMKAKLESLGRLDWLSEDFAELSDPSHFERDPYERYVRLKRSNQLKPKQLGAAREVAAWREIEAAKRNIPRKWLMTDEQIVEACRRNTQKIDDLFMIRGVRGHLSTHDARKVCELVKYGMSLPDEELPQGDRPGVNEQNVDSAVDLMEAVVRVRAKEEGIAMQTLATRSQLTDVARGHFDDTVVMKGWRRTMIGDDLLALLDGKISLALDGLELKIVRE